MGKFANYIGKYEFSVAGYEAELEPKVGDGRKFLKLTAQAEKNKDILFDAFIPFAKEILSRDIEPEDKESLEELESFIDRNLVDVLNQFMIMFGFITQEQLEEQKKAYLQVTNPNPRQ